MLCALVAACARSALSPHTGGGARARAHLSLYRRDGRRAERRRAAAGAWRAAARGASLSITILIYSWTHCALRCATLDSLRERRLYHLKGFGLNCAHISHCFRACVPLRHI